MTLPSTWPEAMTFFASLTPADLYLALLGLATVAAFGFVVLGLVWVVRAAGRKR